MPIGIKGFQRGNNNPSRKNGTWNKGIPHSPKTRARISDGIRGKNNPRWNNGRRHLEAGYIEVRIKNHPTHRRYVGEHRLVIEKLIGRFLKPYEIVHHLGKTSDNRPQKLMAFTSNSAHKRFHKNPKNVKPHEIIFDGRKSTSA